MAGISYETVMAMRYSYWNRTKVVRAIRERTKLGLPLNPSGVAEDDNALYLAARRCFGKGGWRRALRAAGYNPSRVYRRGFWDKARIKVEIRRLKRSGIPLYGDNIIRIGKASLFSMAVRLFGSWGKAIKASGFDYTAVRATQPWTKAKVIAEIRWCVRKGIRLNPQDIMALRGDLVSAATYRFGSWQRAVEAAGFNYRQHLKVWSTKAWLRALNATEARAIEEQTLKFAKRRRASEKTQRVHRRSSG